jgi:hypothetical protein
MLTFSFIRLDATPRTHSAGQKEIEQKRKDAKPREGSPGKSLRIFAFLRVLALGLIAVRPHWAIRVSIRSVRW